MNTQYVVSADVCRLVERWSKQSGFSTPGKEFFSELRKSFCDYLGLLFRDFEFVTEEVIEQCFLCATSIHGDSILTLENVYSQSQYQFSPTRVIDKTLADKGLYHRFGTQPLLAQVRELKKAKIRELAIFDDVIFSGDLIERVARLLAQAGIRVTHVYAGVGIAKGVRRVERLGYAVTCARLYEHVIDQVCERDFYLGVPFSGRLLIGSENVGIPYVAPFGKPEVWASVAENDVQDFSRFCIQQSMRLYEEIERVSGKTLLCKDVPRKLLQSVNCPETRFVDHIGSYL